MKIQDGRVDSARKGATHCVAGHSSRVFIIIRQDERKSCFVELEETKIRVEQQQSEIQLLSEELSQLKTLLEKQSETVVLTERALADAEHLRKEVDIAKRELVSTKQVSALLDDLTTQHQEQVEEEVNRWAQVHSA